MDYMEFAKWLEEGGEYGATDEEFAEFFVYLYKRFKSNNHKELRDSFSSASLNVNDMRSFDIKGFTTWLGNVLDEIINSEDIDASAWWKGEQK